MNKLLTSKIEIIERKIQYNSTIVDHNCLLLEKQSQSIVLFHEVQYSFTMTANDTKLTIPKVQSKYSCLNYITKHEKGAASVRPLWGKGSK